LLVFKTRQYKVFKYNTEIYSCIKTESKLTQVSKSKSVCMKIVEREKKRES
jgi:hypothetical protein